MFLGTICSDIQINNDCKLTVDTDNPLGTNILIFPNPAHEKIQIQSQISFNRLEIYNLDGRKLMCLNESHLTNQTVIDIRSLNSGAYIIKLWNIIGDHILTKFFKL
ncbi:MAG: T9SS type A sorting domain-containing protein [Saprospiraceae bacterium]|nr:T9SS type A sorting domain-containing protein [Candidatus Vicinibacter affinis]